MKTLSEFVKDLKTIKFSTSKKQEFLDISVLKDIQYILNVSVEFVPT